MLRNKFVFPNDFMWGASTASFQVEGGIENNDWAKSGEKGQVPKCGIATNHYNLYRQDFAIAKELHHNAHRFSIEWSRIEPVEGKFDMKEVEHYRKVLRELRTLSLEPFVTLHHFTLPIWVNEKGGIASRKFPDQFARYVKFIVGELNNEADFWITINEPLVLTSNGYLRRNWPPFRKNIFLFLKSINSLILAHNKAYVEIKRINPFLQVGIAKHNIDYETSLNPFSNILTSFLDWFWNYRFLDAIKKYQDFIGINYYFHKKFDDKREFEKSDMGWDIYPKGLRSVLIGVRKYKKPVYVTENGLADAKDDKRADFIESHIRSVAEAIEEGVDVKGYFYWSLLDNYEWAHGFAPRFGLVEVDYATQRRKVRNSALVYKSICEKGQIEI